jgi:hypothetical protein
VTFGWQEPHGIFRANEESWSRHSQLLHSTAPQSCESGAGSVFKQQRCFAGMMRLDSARFVEPIANLAFGFG